VGSAQKKRKSTPQGQKGGGGGERHRPSINARPYPASEKKGEKKPAPQPPAKEGENLHRRRGGREKKKGTCTPLGRRKAKSVNVPPKPTTRSRNSKGKEGKAMLLGRGKKKAAEIKTRNRPGRQFLPSLRKERCRRNKGEAASEEGLLPGGQGLGFPRPTKETPSGKKKKKGEIATCPKKKRKMNIWTRLLRSIETRKGENARRTQKGKICQ